MTPRTGLYFHWPFCDRICPYCDFNVARNRDVDLARWEAVLTEDIDYWASRLGRRAVVSVYFGGGTPSLMPPSLVAAILDRVALKFDLIDGAEITIEANPTDAEISQFEGFRAAGVNRLSLGVQSFDDQHLTFLGRNHDGQTAQVAVERALDCFPRHSFDLIYALPGEAPSQWNDRLRAAFAMGITHLSAYQLTIESGTAFGLAVERGDWVPLSSDQQADLYSVTIATAAAAGVPLYEVSNFAKPECQAVHNRLYWEGADWIGIGPGAHGRVTTDGDRFETVGMRQIKNYLFADGTERYEENALSPSDIAIERLAGGLRLVEGMPVDAVAGAYQPQVRNARDLLVADGWLDPVPEFLRASLKGRLLIDSLVRELTSEIE